MNKMLLPKREEYQAWNVPMVEIFETIEGEGSMAGYPTVFVRSFHCNLRCSWCDTPYSYAPAKPEFEASIAEIIERIQTYPSQRICFTGGEPLIHREKSAALLAEMAHLDHIVDVHIETNGAINLEPFAAMRQNDDMLKQKVRFVMDYKLPNSDEYERMIDDNFNYLEDQDEIKFVIASEEDFRIAVDTVKTKHRKGQVLFSPVWESMAPDQLVEKVLAERLSNVKVSLQLHKVIWDPERRGV